MDESMKHFLLAFDHARNTLLVQREFGTDADHATEAYMELEREHRDNLNVDIVLVGSDSIETVRVTHSTYFPVDSREAAMKRILRMPA